MARKPRKTPEAPLPADQTLPPSDTSPQPQGLAVGEPEPVTKPTPREIWEGLKVETF